MIDMEIDGFYCKECNDIHPTLYWHELYGEYIKTKEEAIPYFKNVCARFGEIITDDDALFLYYKTMRLRGLEYSENNGECVICGTRTHYMLIGTKKYICSNKCKYQAK